MWRTIYLSKLPGLDKKVRVAFDWTLDLLFPKDVCAIYGPDRDFPHLKHSGNGENESSGESLAQITTNGAIPLNDTLKDNPRSAL